MQRFLLIFLTLISAVANAQYRIGQWVDYLPYNSVVSVTKGNGKVYAATGNSVFAVNLEDQSYERLNKISGLHDVGANIVRFNNQTASLIIAYSNSNLDVIKNGAVTNFADILRKNITADKTIHHISMYQQFAYLSTGFGIVVFDMDRMEFKDTYVLGNNGSYLTVYDVARKGDSIFAATANGLKVGLVTSNLADFQNWNTVAGLPGGAYKCVVKFNNSVVASYSARLTSNLQEKDTLYSLENGVWTEFPMPYIDSVSKTYEISRVISDEANGRLMISTRVAVEEWKKPSGWQKTGTFGNNFSFTGYHGYQLSWLGITEGIYVPSSDWAHYYIGGTSFGLAKTNGWDHARLLLDGPATNRVSQMAILNNKMIVAPVYLTEEWTAQYLYSGMYIYKDGTWNNLLKGRLGDSLKDVSSVAYLKNNENHYFAGTWSFGLIEMRNDTLYKAWNETNTGGVLQSATGSVPGDVRIGGLAADSSGNLWIANAFTSKALAVRKPDETWQSFNLASWVPNNSKIGKVFVDRNNQKWLTLVGFGFLVYQDNGTYDIPNNSNTKKITTAAGNGNLPSGDVYSICEDKEGDIWVGTAKGIAVFYNPESILSSSSGWDAQQIIITQNGVAQILLETETVYDIVVDGENNKWVATNQGVYCLSPDGQKEIYHFTVDNSPLFNDHVIDLEYNSKTGDIFFGTLSGIQSYRTEVIDPFDEFTDVYSYPNPVRPGYSGPIVIKGMVQDAVVKITDISGTLVYETTSRGGQALWYGKNFNGERVASGVYVVLCASADGEQRALTKILVIN